MPVEPPKITVEDLEKDGKPQREPAEPRIDLSRGALPKMFEKQVTPLRLFLTSIIAVFVSQFFVSLSLSRVLKVIPSPYAEALLTGVSLVVLIFPVLYAALYRPMIRHMARQQQLEDWLRELATVDELTGILNRRGFRAVADEHLKLARRIKKRLYCLFMDLNGFKRINDNLGHLEGDHALVETAKVLRNTFRESDLVARVGGDEFIVLALETGAGSSEKMVARLLERIAAANAQPGRKYALSLCIGVANSDPGQETSIADLVARADALMYEQKQAIRAAQALSE